MKNSYFIKTLLIGVSALFIFDSLIDYYDATQRSEKINEEIYAKYAKKAEEKENLLEFYRNLQEEEDRKPKVGDQGGLNKKAEVWTDEYNKNLELKAAKIDEWLKEVMDDTEAKTAQLEAIKLGLTDGERAIRSDAIIESLEQPWGSNYCSNFFYYTATDRTALAWLLNERGDRYLDLDGRNARPVLVEDFNIEFISKELTGKPRVREYSHITEQLQRFYAYPITIRDLPQMKDETKMRTKECLNWNFNAFMRVLARNESIYNPKEPYKGNDPAIYVGDGDLTPFTIGNVLFVENSPKSAFYNNPDRLSLEEIKEVYLTNLNSADESKFTIKKIECNTEFFDHYYDYDGRPSLLYHRNTKELVVPHHLSSDQFLARGFSEFDVRNECMEEMLREFQRFIRDPQKSNAEWGIYNNYNNPYNLTRDQIDKLFESNQYGQSSWSKKVFNELLSE